VEKLLKFLKNEEGASAVEYGIMVAAIAAVIITVTILIGDQLKAAFQKVANALGLSGPQANRVSKKNAWPSAWIDDRLRDIVPWPVEWEMPYQ